MTETKKATREEIERRAYEIYLARAGDSGSEVEDWLKAEGQLTGEGAEQLEELPEIEASPAPRPPVRRRAVAS